MSEPFRQAGSRRNVTLPLANGDESVPSPCAASPYTPVRIGRTYRLFCGAFGRGQHHAREPHPPLLNVPQEGEITLRLAALWEDYSLASLRRSVAMVSQDAFLSPHDHRGETSPMAAIPPCPARTRSACAWGGSAGCGRYADGFVSELPGGCIESRSSGSGASVFPAVEEATAHHCPGHPQGRAAPHPRRGHQRP